VNDLGNPRDRHPQIERETIHAELKRFHKVGAQNLAGMDRGKQMLRLSHSFLFDAPHIRVFFKCAGEPDVDAVTQ
jgi:hypothetical protein